MADDISYEGEEMQDVPEAKDATGIVGTIMERFRNSEAGRQLEEERWLKAYKNYRGVYDSSTQYRSNERSQVFIKITKTKVLAAYGQLIDILFANNKKEMEKSYFPVQRKLLILLKLQS